MNCDFNLNAIISTILELSYRHIFLFTFVLPHSDKEMLCVLTEIKLATNKMFKLQQYISCNLQNRQTGRHRDLGLTSELFEGPWLAGRACFVVIHST